MARDLCKTVCAGELRRCVLLGGSPIVEVTGAARLYHATFVWTAGLGIFAALLAPTFWK